MSLYRGLYVKLKFQSYINYDLFAGEHNLSDDHETNTIVQKAKTRRKHKHDQFYYRTALGMVLLDIILTCHLNLVFMSNF